MLMAKTWIEILFKVILAALSALQPLLNSTDETQA